MKSSVNCFSRLSHESEPVSWQSPTSDIGDGHLCVEVPPVYCRRCWFPLLCLSDNCLHQRSGQGLVTVDILDNFLNFIKLFLALASDPMKSWIDAMHDGEWMDNPGRRWRGEAEENSS